MFTGMVFMFLFGLRMIASVRLKQGEGQPIRPKSPQSHLLTEEGTPTMGGLMILSSLILSSLILSTLLRANPDNPYVNRPQRHARPRPHRLLRRLSQGHKAGPCGLLGRTRLTLEFAIAGVARFLIVVIGRMPMSTSLAFPFFKDLLMDFGWSFVVFAAVVIGAGNAVNITGHRADHDRGCLLGAISWVIGNAAFAEYLQVHFVAGASELAVLCGAILGAGIGFL